MKRRLAYYSILVVILLATVGLLALFVHRYNDKPILKSPLQGGDIVTVLEREFEVPNDPIMERAGVFCDSWLYWRGFVWNAGSRISICGVHNTSTQERIIDRIEKEVKKNGLCDVLVVFFGDTKIEKDDRSMRRIEGPELRRVRIIGATKSWRELQSEHESEAQQENPR